MLKVELFIRDPSLGTLLTWRDDEFYGPGWHVPGGIIRFQETAADRVRRTAQNELAAEVAFDPLPFAVLEHVLPSQTVRAYFVSLLYRCTLQTPLDPAREAGDGPRTAGSVALARNVPKRYNRSSAMLCRVLLKAPYKMRGFPRPEDIGGRAAPAGMARSSS
jgi:colanic acid biosynthesis protein WcaH